MKAERPSRTAHYVANGRALADAGFSQVPDFHDPTARVFLGEKGKRSLAKAERAAREGTRRIGVEMARVMADTIALRTTAIDTAVRDAITAGATQLVILGAGYEPQISAWTPEEMAADLQSAGFVLREDSGMDDWNRRFANGKAKVERGFYMRIAIART